MGYRCQWREIQATGKNLKTHIEYGRGTEFQRTFPHIVEFMRENLEKGVCFQHRSVWFRSDLLEHPEFSPPAHGSLSYCETGLVWEQRDRETGFAMFPHFGNEDYLTQHLSGRSNHIGPTANRRGTHNPSLLWRGFEIVRRVVGRLMVGHVSRIEFVEKSTPFVGTAPTLRSMGQSLVKMTASPASTSGCTT